MRFYEMYFVWNDEIKMLNQSNYQDIMFVTHDRNSHPLYE